MAPGAGNLSAPARRPKGMRLLLPVLAALSLAAACVPRADGLLSALRPFPADTRAEVEDSAEEASGEMEEWVEMHPDPPEERPPAPSKPVPAPLTRKEALRKAHAADLSFRQGRAMALLGAGALGLSLAAGSEGGASAALLFPAGLGLYLAGVPLMGNATAQLTALAARVSGKPDSGMGWGLYSGGMVLKGAGAAWLAGAVFASMVIVWPGIPVPTADMDDLAAPMLLMGAGFALDAFTLADFSARRRAAIGVLAERLTVKPTLRRTGGGPLLPGLAVALRF